MVEALVSTKLVKFVKICQKTEMLFRFAEYCRVALIYFENVAVLPIFGFTYLRIK